MWDTEFKKHLNRNNEKFLEHFRGSRNKYIEIWDYYNKHLPACIKECTEARAGYSEKPDRDGPQGIYWIGKDPEILFVGRDHFGWHGDAGWPNDIDSICFSPLQFSFNTIESMGTYWAIIKDVIDSLFTDKAYSWNDKLEKVAFSNACKCLSGNSSYQRNLHANCLKHEYLAKEILTVNAKITVLFTKRYEVLDKLFDSENVVLYNREEFSARRHGSQIIIECAHPGRQSNEWRKKLIKTIKEAMQENRQVSA